MRLKLRIFDEELFALGESDGMRLDDGEVVRACAGHDDQVMHDRDDFFADDFRSLSTRRSKERCTEPARLFSIGARM